jgi:superkiller protein 3
VKLRIGLGIASLLAVALATPISVIPQPLPQGRPNPGANSRAAELHYKQAEALKGKKDWVGAIAEYRQALLMDRNYAEAHNGLCDVLDFDNAHLDEAFSECRDALRLRANYPEAHKNLGDLLGLKDQWDQAIAEYNEAIRLKPFYSEARQNLADAHNRQGINFGGKGRWDQAEHEAREAIRVDGSVPMYHYNLGVALYYQANCSNGIPEFKEALRLQPQFADAGTILGACFEKIGDWDSAITAENEAIRLNPKDAFAHEILGEALAYGKKGDWDSDIREQRTALQLEPNLALAHFSLALALLKTGSARESVSEFRENVRRYPNDYGAHIFLGLAFWKAGDMDASAGEYTEALRLNPESAEGHEALAYIFLVRQDWDRSISEGREAIRLDPQGFRAHWSQGWALGAKGQWDASIAEYESVLRLAASQAESLGGMLAWAHLGIGAAQNAKRNLDGAIAEFRQAALLAPELPDPHVLLAGVLKQKRDSTAASAEYRLAIQLTARSTIAFDNRSGLGATVKLLGPSEDMVEVPSGQSATVKVGAGEYFVIARYDAGSSGYIYTISRPVTIKQTETQRSALKITLQQVPKGGSLSREEPSNKTSPQNQDPRNVITFENLSVGEVMIKMIGPFTQPVTIGAGETGSLKVPTGDYILLVRYGTSPGDYIYSKGGPLKVTETATQHSALKITLHRPSNNDSEAQKEFAAPVPPTARTQKD